jgi:hypothetical protein
VTFYATGLGAAPKPTKHSPLRQTQALAEPLSEEGIRELLMPLRVKRSSAVVA